MQRPRRIKMHVAIFLPWHAIKTGLLIDESVADNPSPDTRRRTPPSPLPPPPFNPGGTEGQGSGVCPLSEARQVSASLTRPAPPALWPWRSRGLRGNRLIPHVIHLPERSHLRKDPRDHVRNPRWSITICAHRYDTVGAISRESRLASIETRRHVLSRCTIQFRRSVTAPMIL